MTTSQAPPGVLLPAYPVHRSALPDGRLRDGRYELYVAHLLVLYGTPLHRGLGPSHRRRARLRARAQPLPA